MKNKFNDDLYQELKLEVVKLVLFLKQIREKIVLMLFTNDWILEDINLFESFTHLKEMVDISNDDLNNLLVRINSLDSDFIIFDVCDLIDELEFIAINIYLESEYIMNMSDYIVIISDSSINDRAIVERLEQYQVRDIWYYNEMKINNENLKQLRKERKDYFE